MAHKVKIKNLTLDRLTDGLEFGVRDEHDNHLGDLYITKYGLTWCEGKKAIQNGVEMKWRTFIKMMEERQNA